MTLGEIIKIYRKSNKLSMDAFSKKAGVSKAYIGFVEGGVNPATNKPITPSIDMIIKLASAMEMSTDDLVKALNDNTEICISSNHNITLYDRHEIQIIENYRQAPEPTQKAIDTLLGVVDEK